MRAFAVKHVARRRGPLVDRIETYRSTPYSFTSKEREGIEAARGNTVYVIEARSAPAGTTYWLGYKYVAQKCVLHPRAGRWENKFKYKIESALPPAVNGCYFDAPAQIRDMDFRDWYSKQNFGMIELPTTYCTILEGEFARLSLRTKMCI